MHNFTFSTHYHSDELSQDKRRSKGLDLSDLNSSFYDGRHERLTRQQSYIIDEEQMLLYLLCLIELPYCFSCWPFAWVPYVVDSCKNANHYCPSCGAYIGKYKQ